MKKHREKMLRLLNGKKGICFIDIKDEMGNGINFKIEGYIDKSMIHIAINKLDEIRPYLKQAFD